MKLTTLCYIEKDGKYLMLHRTKKENDQSHDKWLGIGGRFEEDESPDECILREVKEEAGVKLLKYKFRGIITFVSDIYETEYMHLFTATEYEGEIKLNDCDEGELMWIDKKEVLNLNLWEGDRIFLKRLEEDMEFFSIKLVYQKDKLIFSE